LASAVLDLQRAAGNRAVAEELASIQRDETAAETQIKIFAEQWPAAVTDNLVDAHARLKESPVVAQISLGIAQKFVQRVWGVTLDTDPVAVKLRIFGRGVAGAYDLIDDRSTKGKDVAKDVGNDLRTWRLEAAELGPSLKTGADGKPASIDKWNDGVVFPLGRAILKTGQDDDQAVREASLALEILHMWKEATAKDDPGRLKLISLERAVYTTFQRMRDQAEGSGTSDLAGDIARAVEESKVIGPQIALIKPPPETPAAAPPSKKPFVNDTELMRPGD